MQKMKKSTCNLFFYLVYIYSYVADLAQLVEQLICNHQVVCSSQTIGTIFFNPPKWVVFFTPVLRIIMLYIF